MTASQVITQRDLRNKSAEIMNAVESGESFVVTRNGTPVGELVPIRRRRWVSREEFAAMSVHAPDLNLERFRADQDSTVDSGIHDPYDR